MSGAAENCQTSKQIETWSRAAASLRNNSHVSRVAEGSQVEVLLGLSGFSMLQDPLLSRYPATTPYAAMQQHRHHGIIQL